jgi:hypothetical protein
MIIILFRGINSKLSINEAKANDVSVRTRFQLSSRQACTSCELADSQRALFNRFPRYYVTICGFLKVLIIPYFTRNISK